MLAEFVVVEAGGVPWICICAAECVLVVASHKMLCPNLLLLQGGSEKLSDEAIEDTLDKVRTHGLALHCQGC